VCSELFNVLVNQNKIAEIRDKILQIWKEERPGVQEGSGTFSKNNLFLKYYGRMRKELGMKCDKF